MFLLTQVLQVAKELIEGKAPAPLTVPLIVTPKGEVEADRPTLVVIDMQTSYRRYTPASEQHRLVEAVRAEIVFAMGCGLPIVFVELAGKGGTEPALLDIVDGYDQVAIVRKVMQSGAEEVIMACEKNGFNAEHFRVTGRSTHDCVFHTVMGLLYENAVNRIDVVADACFPREDSAFRHIQQLIGWTQRGRLVRA